MRQIHYFSNLRTFLVCLVVIAHVACMYLPLPYLETYNCPEIPGMGSLILVLRSFLMSLFFFTSGYFVPGSYDRHGTKKFILKKSIRLGIPVLILMPLGLGHLWFLGNLLLLCFLYSIKRQYVKKNLFSKKEMPSLFMLLKVCVFVGILCSSLRLLYAPGYWIEPVIFFKFEPVHTPQYILLFCLGVLSYRFNWINQISDRNACVALFISVSLMIFAVFHNGFSKNDTIYHWSYGLYETIICVFFDYGILWLFKKYCNVNNPFLEWCSNHSFAVHIVHANILLIVAVYCQKLISNAYFQIGLVFFITIVVSLIASFLLKLLPGVKRIL